jgi:putative flippase GtrA
MSNRQARINSAHLRQPLAYALVGVANTAITAATIFCLMGIGASLVASNAVGYVVGLLVSFLLNSRVTFQVQASRMLLVRFLAASGIAYLANLVVVVSFAKATGSTHIAQIVGMPVYTAVGYITNKYWAMKR